jgi:hypothetical protein
MIPLLSPRFHRMVTFLGVLLFFTPKINLINVQHGESAGIRIDDIIIVIIFSLLMIGFYAVGRSSLTRLEVLFCGLVLSFCTSNILNIIIYGQSNILYSFRYIEYFLFFYVGYYYATKYSIKTLIIWILAINGIVMVLQVLNLVGGFSSEGFRASSSDRAIGLTGGPWEIGAMLNFIFAIYLFDDTGTSKRRINLIFLVTFSLILISGARMPTLAHLLLFLIYKFVNSKNRVFFVLSLSLYIGIFVCLLILIPNPVTQRSGNLLSTKNIELFGYYYDKIQIYQPFRGFPIIVNLSAAADTSWLMRIAKWAYAIKDFLHSPLAWFFGVGPGLWGRALDGGWTRIMTECGLIGIVAFTAFFKRAMQVARPVFGVVIALYISMLMIDIHMAYKAMALVFFTVGYYYQHRLNIQLVKQA